MDFELDVAQQVIATSAADVLRGADTGDAAWQAMAKAGLLALTLPGWLDGDELGVLEAAVLLTEVGRAAASVPALNTIMLGALPVTRWGSRDQQEQMLAGVGTGDAILSAAVRETSTPMPVAPATTATLTGDGRAGTVTGTKVGVRYAAQARWLLVPATTTGGGRAVVIVDPAAGGVDVCLTPACGDVPEYTVRLDRAPITGVLGTDQQETGEAVDDLYRLAAAGAAAMADGALAGALDLTARYVASREQFGKPLATFQAVAQQIADVYVTSRTLHLAALSACWRLAVGLDPAQDVDIAAYWLAQEAPAAVRTCHHLHGGIGLDVEYPLHRYSSMISDLVRFVGGADYRLSLLSEIRGSGNVR
ncbi:MAG TPA: acyl-CoA dehydrogenase family protein [Streptosporangiaceae bacterium]|nr:acyl-CoA dehydrogenase family protein [Streptosporangiaceae bacterium]